MKRIDVLDYKKFAFIFSALFVIVGIVFAIIFGGFNTGIDFGSGYSQQIQIAPMGMAVSYKGSSSATLSVSSGSLVLQVRDASGVKETAFPSASYPTVADLAKGLENAGLTVSVQNGKLATDGLVSGFGFPATLSATPTRLNFATSSNDVSIEDLRSALSGMNGVNVQTVGSSSSGKFQVRISLNADETQEAVENRVSAALSHAFGQESVVTMQSDFVGPKFSSSLLKSSIMAVGIALVLILGYIAIRFRFAYAISSIIALMHDVLMMLSFVMIFRLEVSSTTIAAVLTIIGYSLNNTIVIFDRVRENLRDNKGADPEAMVNWSVRQSFTRTIITTVTTLFAIVPLAIFSTGGIKLFAINLIWGLIIGAYSSNFIAPGLLIILHRYAPINKEREKKDEEEYSLVD